MGCGKKFPELGGVIIIPPILPYKYPYITIIIIFFIMKIFFHRVVIIGIEVLEMKELWRGQKSKNVEIYFSTKIEKVLYQ